MRTCPRCKISQSPNHFVGRVRLCISCYSTIPANMGLSATELISKMKRARINRAIESASRRSVIDNDLDEILNTQSESKPEPPATSIEEILNLTKGDK